MFGKNKIYKNLWANIFLVFVFAVSFSAVSAKSDEAHKFLSYAELTTLYESEILPEPLEIKLKYLLTNPFVKNSNVNPKANSFSKSAGMGEYIRVAHWNIERGLQYEVIEAAFTDLQKFASLLNKEDFPANSGKRFKILKEAALLQGADVIILDEVDWGIKRSKYQNIAGDLAGKLGMNYAFGVQFVELSPIYLSKKESNKKDEKAEVLELIKVDSARYKGLHGIAILSRFPLENVRLVPFKHQPYDWFMSEKKGPDMLEKGKRKLAKTIFLEETLREVRRGGRTTLYAEIAHEKFPNGRVSIVATHLENRAKPKHRVAQLNEILTEIKDVRNPIILAGDMNTSGKDLRPTSIQRELTKRFGSPKFWIKSGIKYALGFGMYEDILMGTLSFGRTQGDPTVKDIPYISPNPARKFFSTLEDFRFSDGGTFDFRGDEERSVNGGSKHLSNSNERADKGFETTYQVKRPLQFIGKYKLDWFFVKPANLKSPGDKNASYRFAPHFGQTLSNLNKAVEDRISDHRPLVVELPLNEPRISLNH